MILKRKQLKAANVGDMATINHKALTKMRHMPGYKSESVSNYCLEMFLPIHRKNLRKSNIGNNKVFLCDAKLVYINKKSIFGDDIVEVVPLKIIQDDYNYAMKHLAKEKKLTFLINKNALDYANRNVVQKVLDSMNSRVADQAERIIQTYVNPNFSWAGK